MQEIKAIARKDGRWWLVDIPSLDSAGQAARLDDVEQAAQEVIELMTDQKPGSYRLLIDYVMPADIKLAWDGSRERDRRAREEQAIAARLARQTVRGVAGARVQPEGSCSFAGPLEPACQSAGSRLEALGKVSKLLTCPSDM